MLKDSFKECQPIVYGTELRLKDKGHMPGVGTFQPVVNN